MKKKLLLVLLFLSSSIDSINADFKQIFHGKISFQSKGKENKNKLAFLSELPLRQNKPIIQSQQSKILTKFNLNQEFNKNLITAPLLSKKFSFINFFQRIPKSLFSSHSTLKISDNTSASTNKLVSEVSSEIIKTNNTTSQLNHLNPSLNPNSFEPVVDLPTLSLSPVTPMTSHTLISEPISVAPNDLMLTTVEDTKNLKPTLTKPIVIKSEITNSEADQNLMTPESNYRAYKGSKETLKPDITSQRLNLLKEIKERSTKSQTINGVKIDIKDINEVQEKLKNTVTGALIDYDKPANKSFEEALGFKVRKMLSKIAKDEKNKNKIASPSIIQALKANRPNMEKEVTDLCREVLIKSTEYSDNYYTFYHGHGNGLRLYFDILREIKSFETIRNLDSNNPLRDKSTHSTDNTVEEILSNYEQKALDYAERNNQSLYDLKRGMGVGFAPDKIGYFRDHVISVNPSLFGNMNNLAECTLFYWLDSFNISNPNEILVKNLLMRIATYLPAEQITHRIAQ